jgi:WD40 repeat protein
VRITDLSTGKVVKVFEGHTHHVLGVSWRADGRMLASSGADNVVKVWDWTTGDRRKNVDGWDKEVTGIRYLGAADQIATSAGDTKLRLITSDGGEVKKLPAPPASCNPSPPIKPVISSSAVMKTAAFAPGTLRDSAKGGDRRWNSSPQKLVIPSAAFRSI